jgi:hypothetical protein
VGNGDLKKRSSLTIAARPDGPNARVDTALQGDRGTSYSGGASMPVDVGFQHETGGARDTVMSVAPRLAATVGICGLKHLAVTSKIGHFRGPAMVRGAATRDESKDSRRQKVDGGMKG